MEDNADNLLRLKHWDWSDTWLWSRQSTLVLHGTKVSRWTVNSPTYHSTYFTDESAISFNTIFKTEITQVVKLYLQVLQRNCPQSVVRSDHLQAVCCIASSDSRTRGLYKVDAGCRRIWSRCRRHLQQSSSVFLYKYQASIKQDHTDHMLVIKGSTVITD